MNRNWLRWTLLGQVLFFAGWAGFEESKRYSAPIILLETMPVDPRDLFAGQYMALRYRISLVDGLPGFPKEKPKNRALIAVLLKPSKNVNVGGRGYQLWEAVQCQVPPPDDLNTTDGVWVTGKWIAANNVIYGIEKYYFSEKRMNELSNIGSGNVYVEVSVGKGGKLALKNLVY